MTAITWLKHHHGAALDAKWLAVADMAGSTPANVWSIFSGALEYASEQTERGSIAGLNPQILASFYRIAVDEVRQVLTALKEIGVLVGDRVTNWAKRQGTNLGSPARPVSPGALRTRRWRRNKAADERQGTLDLGSEPSVTTVTPGVTPSVTVTAEEEGRAKSPPSSIDESLRAPLSFFENNEGGFCGRDAPLSTAQPSEEKVVKLADSPAVKAKKKEARRQKVIRFILAKYSGAELERRMKGMIGLDETRDEQWWFDKCDAERRVADWDDVRDRERSMPQWRRLA
jgi:hypothetical protein